MSELLGKSKLWYFENFNFLESMNKLEMQELSRCSVMREVEKNQSVYLPHDISSRIYFLKKGKVKISSFSDEGRELIHAILGPGEMFGELALAGESTREHFAIVTEDSLVCQVGVPEFENFLKENPLLNLEVTKLIGFRLKRIRARLERMWFKSAPDRIKSLLVELAQDHGKQTGSGVEISLRLTHRDLASLAATTRQTVTTVLNRIEKEGVISYNRQTILIKSINSLS
jgi:CRP-like cAMP-binding protein